MEIQRHGPGSFTAVTPCVSQFAPAGGFPLEVRLPYLLLVRRSSSTGDDEVRLRFNLIDEDGRDAGQPSQVRVAGTFPPGQRVLLLAGQILFSFPRPGDYRLDITAGEETSASLFAYDIEIGAGPEG
jgi:hypothetical protein